MWLWCAQLLANWFSFQFSAIRCRFNLTTPSHRYMNFHCAFKTILRLSYLYSGISYAGKMASIYWDGIWSNNWADGTAITSPLFVETLLILVTHNINMISLPHQNLSQLDFDDIMTSLLHHDLTGNVLETLNFTVCTRFQWLIWLPEWLSVFVPDDHRGPPGLRLVDDDLPEVLPHEQLPGVLHCLWLWIRRGLPGRRNAGMKTCNLNRLRPTQNGRHFCRRHFKIKLLVWKLLCFDYNFT